jgi:hypothetical protein
MVNRTRKESFKEGKKEVKSLPVTIPLAKCGVSSKRTRVCGFEFIHF